MEQELGHEIEIGIAQGLIGMILATVSIGFRV